VFDLTRKVAVKATVLADPDRVVVDLPEVEFRIDAADGQKPQGLITAFRYGLFGPRQSRLVIDTHGPVRVVKADASEIDGGAAVLTIELARVDRARASALKTAPVQRAAVAEPDPQQQSRRKTKPVIILDAGHGGVDPGAVGSGGLLEKDIALGVSRQLRALLNVSGRYKVVMTRNSDVYVPLDERVRISVENQSDLFISIHADSVAEDAIAQAIRGGTIYMLSDHASDEQARRLAEKENAADVLAGLDSTPAENQDAVRNILVDLLRRETTDFSSDFRGLVTGELRKHIALSREPQRSAAFKVLKQTHSPSVLIELGYMSNPEDLKLLRSAEWQKRVADGIAAAIEAFFTKRAVGALRSP
jgi:N-acetylmuramoyl-L-alanine amidase